MAQARRRAQRGFTLIELVVASAIMAMALGMLYRALGASANNIARVEEYQRAAVLADSLLAQAETIPVHGWNEMGKSAEFTWRVQTQPFATTVADLNAPQLQQVELQVTWPGGGELRLQTLRPQRKPAPGGGGR
ncbi:prepilin-type N-terminal cleavage/methylation domain-containing protein [Ramlibacter sp. H39-3-26]|uniref:type II secretion system protein n=1 Tax=Curvibacter soli TaxID=3031331 RepID=UPI0023DC20F6|nr:prepilin-type N-terminal cleavage/methylation domain-containing protein [Ramlibacter sp. H39-3-26]MDF1486408.1 prepilin-type N-terminal cleavage/methylation domain-containing protein [Ramlibacter sp. H39-3-26]